ncbi:MAG: hypothetical protein KBS70_07390 [Bacteroidales bacterium]|nr:hypothetical protein [Candidatus Colicola equi]
MARYTELLSEYLAGEGRELPSSFSLIEGFSDLFIGHYADHEIGFETEDLFALKLEHYADLHLPIYASRINLLNSYILRLEDPEKIRQTIHDMGAVEGLQWVLPFDSDESDPSAKTRSEQYQNVDTNTESGYTPDEILRVIELLNGDVKNLKLRLLEEFKNIFMRIY